jgi:hypothetical protein
MRGCPSCGAPVAPHAAFCGECGTELPDPSPDDVPGAQATATLIQREIRAQRAEDRWLTDRSRGAFYLVVGGVGLAVGYWLAFVGVGEHTGVPARYGTSFTYPLPGYVLLSIGLIAVLAGVLTLRRADA